MIHFLSKWINESIDGISGSVCEGRWTSHSLSHRIMHDKEHIPSANCYQWEKNTGGKARLCYCFVEGGIHSFRFVPSSPEQSSTHSGPWWCITKRIFSKGQSITILRTATSKTAKEEKIPQNDANIPDKRPLPVTSEDKEKCLKTVLG